ncbi:MAG: hypothetical protein Q9187_006607 [Circinaria calcarea]
MITTAEASNSPNLTCLLTRATSSSVTSLFESQLVAPLGMQNANVGPVNIMAPEAETQDPRWPVYRARFVRVDLPNRQDQQQNPEYEAVFVEIDLAQQSGRLMGLDTFPNDPLVGTKYGLPSSAVPRRMPTFRGERLVGYITPESLYRLNAICRTVAVLEHEDSPVWVELALEEIKSEVEGEGETGMEGEIF